uniref:Uncharacterized protein n=1 Tax=Acanthochromis polyacanthus TaxID=80966 RepID=A0A3Q1GP41_9TELE
QTSDEPERTEQSPSQTVSPDYSRIRLQGLKTSQQYLTASCSKQENALRASYLVAHRVAKLKKPHTIAEAMDMVREVMDQPAADKLKTIALSNDSISRRIEDMSGHFAIQMDESTDVSSRAVLIVYVRHVWDGDFQEQFLCTRDLPTTTTREEIFNSVNLYLSSVGLSWDMCVGVTTDGAASMTGKNSVVVRRILEKAPSATWNHCFLHRQALTSKDMGQVLHETLKDVIQVVNYIKRSAKNSRCFQKLCQDLGSEHLQVLYHAEVRWLSRAEITAFLSQNNSPLADVFSSKGWLALVDMQYKKISQTLGVVRPTAIIINFLNDIWFKARLRSLNLSVSQNTVGPSL